MSYFKQQFQKIKTAKGFIAALDQSGGSTPKTLNLYGINKEQYSNEKEMFDIIHEMRTRIITNPTFNKDRILGAILFQNTLERNIKKMPTAQYLWEKKSIVPFLKIDKGLDEEQNNVQLMKPIPDLDSMLDFAKSQNVFGTKMRSVIKNANAVGIANIVSQQFTIAKQIIAKGLVPIIEPEVDIYAPEKSHAENLLLTELLTHLDTLQNDQFVMIKITLPNKNNLYKKCIEHPQVLRVVALSGGYSREIANKKLSQNYGIIASFSRALSEGLSIKQSEDEFTNTLDASIQTIFDASTKK
ncbi:MAG: fructose bisphosphate aldolase [Candidatus Moraniibacteriota bacterium]|nr:MAG: fructose bisphosphate aldolase [Candidatus Moranbacteria bacterium]